MSTLLKQHLNTHKQQLRTLGLQIIIHHTHAPEHKCRQRMAVVVVVITTNALPLPVVMSHATNF
jgi:hypothetical protein